MEKITTLTSDGKTLHTPELSLANEKSFELYKKTYAECSRKEKIKIENAIINDGIRLIGF